MKSSLKIKQVTNMRVFAVFLAWAIITFISSIVLYQPKVEAAIVGFRAALIAPPNEVYGLASYELRIEVTSDGVKWSKVYANPYTNFCDLCPIIGNQNTSIGVVAKSVWAYGGDSFVATTKSVNPPAGSDSVPWKLSITFPNVTGIVELIIPVQKERVLQAIEVKGPGDVLQGTTAAGRYSAWAIYDRGSPTYFSSGITWSLPGGNGSISPLFGTGDGVLNTAYVSANTSAAVTATFPSANLSGSKIVTIHRRYLKNIKVYPGSAFIDNKFFINKNEKVKFSAIAEWDAGGGIVETSDVTSQTNWTVITGASYASFSPTIPGELTGTAATSNQDVAIGGTFTVQEVGATPTTATVQINGRSRYRAPIRIEVQGPAEVAEERVGAATYSANLIWDNGDSNPINATWAVLPPDNATHSFGTTTTNILNTGSVSASKYISIAASMNIAANYVDYPDYYIGQSGPQNVLVLNLNNRLVGLTISPVTLTQVPESKTNAGSYAAIANYEDGSTADVTNNVVWATNNSVASFDPVNKGTLNTSSVVADQIINITATLENQVATKSITVLNSQPQITSLTINGPLSVNEWASATYSATAHFADAPNQTVTPQWSLSSTKHARIAADGILTSSSVIGSQVITLTATYRLEGVTKQTSIDITLNDTVNGLASLRILGPSAIAENSVNAFTAEAIFEDGTIAIASPIWNENSPFSTIASDGLLTVGLVAGVQTVTISASVTAGQVFRSAKRLITILDSDGVLPATSRVSVSNGTRAQANNGSDKPSISNNGQFVAFSSIATNIVSNDSNLVGDVFVHDRLAGSTLRVSVNANGQQANGVSKNPRISGDGRFAVFESDASNLVSGDANGVTDIFVYDRTTGITELVSKGLGGVATRGRSVNPSISGDGQWVAFESEADNVIGNDTNKQPDIFLYERSTGIVQLISEGIGKAASNGASSAPIISGDGGAVVFASMANNLIPGDSNGFADIFLYDRAKKILERVSVTNSGNEYTGNSSQPSISNSGRYVAYSTIIASGNLSKPSIAVRDRVARRTASLNDINSSGDESPSVSNDGRFVTFSRLNQSADGVTTSQVLVHDFITNKLQTVSVNQNNVDGNGSSGSPTITLDGRFIAFRSNATDLVNADTNGANDVFVRDVGAILATPKVWLEPNTHEASLGSQVNIDLRMDFSSDATVGGGMDIYYDSNLFDFVAFDANPAIGSDVTFTRSPIASQGNLKALSFGHFDGIGSASVVGTLRFNARAVGTGTFDISGNVKPLSDFHSAILFGRQNVLYTGSAITIIDPATKDTDKDGVPDVTDAFPFDPREWKDTDGDGIGDNADLDDDNDQMDDQWEVNYFETLGRDGNGDFDGDGLTDRQEFQFGMNPLVADDTGYLWTKTLGGAGTDVALDPVPAAVDRGGNFYLAGSFDVQVDFNGNGLNAQDPTPKGADAFISKFDKNRKHLWTKTFGQAGQDAINAITVDDAGNIYVLGKTSEFVDVDGNGSNDIKPGVFVARFAANGAFVWSQGVKEADGNPAVGNDYIVSYSIAISKGDLYVAGELHGNMDFNPDGPSQIYSAGAHAYSAATYLTKYSATSGKHAWTKVFGPADPQQQVMVLPYGGLALDKNGHIYVAGSFFGSVDFNPTQPSAGNAYTDIRTAASGATFVVKINNDGSYGRTNIFGSSGAGYESPRAIAVDATGSVYITGSAGDVLEFGSGIISDPAVSRGLQDAFLTKIGSDGTYQWTRTLGSAGGSSDADEGRALSIGEDGAIVVVGSRDDAFNFYPDELSNKTLPGSGGFFAARFNSDGAYLRGWTFGKDKNAAKTSGIHLWTLVALSDVKGSLYIGGGFYGSFDFDPTTTVDTHLSNGDMDAFISKYRKIGVSTNVPPLAGNLLFRTNGVTTVNDRLDGSDIDSDSLTFSLVSNGTKGTATLLNAATGAFTYSMINATGTDTFTYKVNDGELDSNIGTVTIRVTSSLDSDADSMADAWENQYFSTLSRDGSADYDLDGVTDVNEFLTNTNPLIANNGKTMPGHDYQWTKTFGGDGYEYATRTATDTAGNVYVSGYFKGSVDFDPSDVGTDFRITSATTGNSAFVTKINKDGTYGWTWTTNIPNLGWAWASSLAVDGSGNVYVTGSVAGNVEFTPGVVTAISASPIATTYLTKLNSNGTQAWTHLIGGSQGGGEGWAVTISPDGSIYLTGEFAGTADFNPGVAVDQQTAGQLGPINYAVFLSKFNADGSYAWTRFAQPTSAAGAAYSYDLVADTQHVYVVGQFFGTFDFDGVLNNGEELVNSRSRGYDGFAGKWTKDGLFVKNWQIRGLVDASRVWPRSIALDTSGSLYLVGSFYDRVDFDPTAGVDERTLQVPTYQTDAFITKITASGGYSWTKTFGNTRGSLSYSGAATAVATSGDRIYVGGYFSGQTDFDPSASIDQRDTADAYTPFVAQYRVDGSYLGAWSTVGAYGQFYNNKFINNGGSVYGLSVRGNRLYAAGYYVGALNFNSTGIADVRMATPLVTGLSSDDVFVTAWQIVALPAFIEGANGLSIEAEHADENVGVNGQRWEDRAAIQYSGGIAKQALPENAIVVAAGDLSPRMTYEVYFTKPGTHYVWVRGQGPNLGADTLHIGLDGQQGVTMELPSQFGWTNKQPGGSVAVINVPAIGRHFLTVWMSEDSALVDKLVISTSSTYNPGTGSGPIESERVLVTATNVGPTLLPILDKTIVEGTTLSFRIFAKDPDGRPLVSATNLPAGATFDASRGQFSWMPSVGVSGPYQVTFTVTDALDPLLRDTQTMTITVAAKVFIQANTAEGAVIMEAENADISTFTNSHEWNNQAAAGYSGGLARQVLPDSGLALAAGNASPRMSYQINFVKTGVHYLWIRGLAPNASADSIHLGLDGQFIMTMPLSSSISWGNQKTDGSLAVVNVSTTGLHTLNVWMAEDGAIVDKLLLTTNAVYSPGTGASMGPEESARTAMTATNIAPVLNPVGNKEVIEGALLTFTLTAIDLDGTKYQFSGGVPVGATLNRTTGVFSWKPAAGQAGIHQLTFYAVDILDSGLLDSEPVTITVTVNKPPVLSPIGSKTISEGKLLSFTVAASDPDGTKPILSATGLPAGASFNTTTGNFSWTPTAGTAGSYSVTFTATDGLISTFKASEIVTITVSSANPTPILKPIGNRLGISGTTLSFVVTASDPDGTVPVLSVAGLPTGASFSSATGGLSWILAPKDAGSYQVTFTATDSVNSALTASEAITIVIGVQAFIQNSGSDGILAVEAENADSNWGINGHLWEDREAGAYVGLFARQAWPDNGMAVIPSVAIDSGSPKMTYQAYFVKTGLHYVWIRGTGPDINADTVYLGLDKQFAATLQLPSTLNLTNKQPDATLAIINVPTTGLHTLEILMAEDGAIIDQLVLSSSPTYIPPVALVESQRTIVTPTNIGPLLNPIGSKIVKAGAALSFTVTAKDLDNTVPLLSINALPAGATFDAKTGSFSWVPALIGAYTLKFTASDAVQPLLQDSETVTITIQ